MRYNAETGKISITLGEFVAVARRGISPTLSRDQDEPHVSPVTKSRLERLYGGLESRQLTLEFTGGSFNFILSGEVEGLDGDTIIIARTVTGNPSKPKKNELSEIRGEGYILGLMLARNLSLPEVKIQLLLLNEVSGESDVRTETVALARLEEFFGKCLVAVALFAAPEVHRVTERLPSMRKLRFPYPKIREGQSEFVRGAYRVLSRGGTLYATAPTGTGKTVSALYPAIRTLGDGRVDKVFYLTPKTTTATAAADCLKLMADKGAKIRAVMITAKEKICPMGHICKKAKRLCPRSAFNRLAEAALDLFNQGRTVVGRDEILEVADRFGLCPYELSLCYAELCDVVICDVNYLFDPVVYIKRFFDEGGKFAFLVDEAHNLSERAREMYTADLSLYELYEPYENPILGPLSATKKLAGAVSTVFSDQLLPFLKNELRHDSGGRLVGATHTTEIPTKLYEIFDQLLSVVSEEIRLTQSARDNESEMRLAFLRDYYYKIKKYAMIMSRFDSGYKLMIFYDEGDIKTHLYCLDTAPVIAERLAKGHSALMFSATLSPLDYYRSILGGDRSDEILEVNSPFDPGQLSVCIVDSIGTRLSERYDTLNAVVQAIAATVSAKRGNYMIFSPSFAYSHALAKAFRAKYPKIRVLFQDPGMTTAGKEEFLQEFTAENGSYLVAFCVMGGVFSEGIDLAGDALIGAIIVGIGMPAISYEREAIAEYYQDKYEEGKQYAYVYPGMNRVFQAAGRVIRREDDRGVIVLIDDRFDDPIYKKSLPKLWEGVKFMGSARDLKAEIEEFWRADENN